MVVPWAAVSGLIERLKLAVSAKPSIRQGDSPHLRRLLPFKYILLGETPRFFYPDTALVVLS